MSQPAFSALAPLPFEIIYDDGEPLESDWHIQQLPLFREAILRAMRLQERTDFFIGTNMGVYYSVEQAREVYEEETKGKPKRAFRGPDIFWAGGVPNPDQDRNAWLSWEEGRLPDVIIELLSPKTARLDRTVKKDLYEQVFRTGEYFLVDPAKRRVEGFDLVDGVYHPKAPTTQGRVWCRQLDAWLGFWKGPWQEKENHWCRLFDRAGDPLPTLAEAAQQKAEAAQQKAEAAQRKAEAAQQKAEAAQQRAEAAEAELARLRARPDALSERPGE
jgi:Uma2 family endonuclease